LTARRKPARKPYEGAGRQPLQPDSSRPPALYVRLDPESEAALDVLEPARMRRSEAVRDLLRAHAESPQVRAAFAAWRAARPQR
jgi:hypothetical protein